MYMYILLYVLIKFYYNYDSNSLITRNVYIHSYITGLLMRANITKCKVSYVYTPYIAGNFRM